MRKEVSLPLFQISCLCWKFQEHLDSTSKLIAHYNFLICIGLLKLVGGIRKPKKSKNGSRKFALYGPECVRMFTCCRRGESREFTRNLVPSGALHLLPWVKNPGRHLTNSTTSHHLSRTNPTCLSCNRIDAFLCLEA